MARGRRCIPLTFSPDLMTTPLGRHQARRSLNSHQPHRLLLPSHSSTRASPRKRLTLHDSPPAPCSPSPDKAPHSPLAKRLCLAPPSSSVVTAAHGLSQPQLVSLLSKLLGNHPELQQEVVVLSSCLILLIPKVASLLPLPDLAALEDHLNYLKRNIYKALPSTRLESKTDSLAYNRVSVHLVAFKRAVSEGLRGLVESRHWLSTIDFTMMAWTHVR